MKKTIPFISTLVFGLFGGLLVECALCALSIISSPFSNIEDTSFLAFLCIVSVLSVLLIIAMVIVNIRYLMEQNSKKKIKITIIAEVIIGILLLLIFWKISEYAVKELYHLL